MSNKQTMKDSAVVLKSMRDEIGKVVVGQERLVNRLIIALLCKGHVLIEGVPGLAKTLTVSTLAQTMHASFNRVQFTPDLLPGDLIGTLIYSQKTGEFYPHKGPVFANLILADEINRSPAKVQSALLEAMQERQVTIGDVSYPLDAPFMVMATQNPIEQEGTYQLPEAQLDRFFFKLTVDYPELEEEHLIMRRMARFEPVQSVPPVFTIDEIIDLQRRVEEVFIKDEIEWYILHLVDATRRPEQYGLGFGELIRHGASPRASIFLSMAARAHAMLDGRDYVTPDDVEAIGLDVLRHRVALTYRAEARGVKVQDLLGQIFDQITVD